MAVITLDFESPYAAKCRGDHPMYGLSLSKQTYEEYIFDPRFKEFGFAVKIDDTPTEWVGESDVAYALRDLFPAGNPHTMIAHNCLFDGAILSWRHGLAAAKYICTQAMSKGLWNQRRSSLKQLCISCFPDDDSVRKGDELVQFANVYDLTPEEESIMAGYAINDVDITFECVKKMWPYLPDSELELIDLTLKMGIHPAFVLDAPKVQTFLATYNKETDEIVQRSGVPSEVLSSTKQFPRWVKDNLGLDIPIIPSPTLKDPDKTKYALGKDEIAFVEFQQDHPQFQHVWDGRLRCASSLDRTRAERMLSHGMVTPYNPEGRIATPLQIYAAHTHRWGGTNKINFQNLRRGSPLRLALRAPEGYRLCIADLSNIEGRVLAWFAQEHQLLNIFRDGGDVYCDFASGIYHRPITKADPTERFIGKTCILGLGFGTGPAKLRTTIYLGSRAIDPDNPIDLTLDQCKDIVYDKYRGRYTQVVKAWADADYAIARMFEMKTNEQEMWNCLVVEKGRIRLPNGMYLNYPAMTCEMDEQGRPQYEYFNGKHMTNLYGGKLIENVIQALARIILAEMMLDINRELQSKPEIYGDEARVILTVHDEIIGLAKTNAAENAFAYMLERMSIPPAWCNDGTLTLAAEGGVDDCYSK